MILAALALIVVLVLVVGAIREAMGAKGRRLYQVAEALGVGLIAFGVAVGVTVACVAVLAGLFWLLFRVFG